jgi:hypothetical protein
VERGQTSINQNGCPTRITLVSSPAPPAHHPSHPRHPVARGVSGDREALCRPSNPSIGPLPTCRNPQACPLIAEMPRQTLLPADRLIAADRSRPRR